MNAACPSERAIAFRLPGGRLLRGVVCGPAGGDAAPAGPPEVVFSPGNGFTAATYLPALAPLAARTRVHALDPAGLGGSDPPGRFSDWEGFVADLRAYVEEAARPPVVLAGHSFGAVLALRLAALAPALARGLLLLEPLVRNRRGGARPTVDTRVEADLLERTRTRRRHWASRAEADADLRLRGGYRDWAGAPWRRFLDTGLVAAEEGGVRLACAPEQEVAIYTTVPGPALFDWAAAARAPGAILRGMRSPFVDPAGLEDLAAALPVGVVYALGGTHAFPMERPGPTGRVLAEALDVLAATALAESPDNPGGG